MIQLSNANAWVELPEVKPASIDLILTDPPYMPMPSRFGTDSEVERSPDANKIVGVFSDADFEIFALHAFRVLKPGRHLYCFTQEKVFHKARPSLERAGFVVRGTLVWVKKNYTKGSFDSAREIHWDYPIQTELIIYAHKPNESGRVRQLRGSIHSNLLTEFPNLSSNQMIHPTQKPVPLCAYLIERSSEPGELVLDPFAGIGTTLLAARDKGRDAIGYEIVEEFYRKGCFLIAS